LIRYHRKGLLWIRRHNRLSQFRDPGQLTSIYARVRHFMRNNQMMCRIDSEAVVFNSRFLDLCSHYGSNGVGDK
jgi:hypothetical protein